MLIILYLNKDLLKLYLAYSNINDLIQCEYLQSPFFFEKSATLK